MASGFGPPAPRQDAKARILNSSFVVSSFTEGLLRRIKILRRTDNIEIQMTKMFKTLRRCVNEWMSKCVKIQNERRNEVLGIMNHGLRGLTLIQTNYFLPQSSQRTQRDPVSLVFSVKFPRKASFVVNLYLRTQGQLC